MSTENSDITEATELTVANAVEIAEPSQSSGIVVGLVEEELWKKFDEPTNEMYFSKHGRYVYSPSLPQC